MVLLPGESVRTSVDVGPLAHAQYFACDSLKNHAPSTPSEWFTRKFPAEARTYGSAFVEQKKQVSGLVVSVTPIALNTEFMAAILGGGALGPRVVYFPPDFSFYFQEQDGIFKQTSEQKLQSLLRGYLMKCAEEMPVTVDKLKLVLDYRDDNHVRAIVKRAKSILAADSTFFSADSPYMRQRGPEVQEVLIRQFVQNAMEKEPTTFLTVTDAYHLYTDFLEQRKLEAPDRRLFKPLVVPIVKEEWNVGLRNDLKDANGVGKSAWKGLTASPLDIG